MASGDYKFSIASEPDAKVSPVEGPVAERADGDFWVPARRRKYTGTVANSFEEFLSIWGEVLLTPIIDEVGTRPTKSGFFLNFANKPVVKLAQPLPAATEQDVVRHFTDQTGLVLKKESRPIQVLFIEQKATR